MNGEGGRKRLRGLSTASILKMPFWQHRTRSDTAAAVVVDHRSLNRLSSAMNPAFDAMSSTSLNGDRTSTSNRPVSTKTETMGSLAMRLLEELSHGPNQNRSSSRGKDESLPRVRNSLLRMSNRPEHHKPLTRPYSAMSRGRSRDHKDSLDELEFDERPQMPFRYPLLDNLSPRALREFKKELETAEDMRRAFNDSSGATNAMPRPEPRQLITKRLWSQVLVQMQKINPNLGHFLDVTYDDMETWLARALVPAPNNRPFMKKLEQDLKEAWANSYFFGLPRTCFPAPSSSSNHEGFQGTSFQEEGDVLWDLPVDDEATMEKPVDPKKLSTTSSITTWSFRSKVALSDDDHDYQTIVEETQDVAMATEEEEPLVLTKNDEIEV